MFPTRYSEFTTRYIELITRYIELINSIFRVQKSIYWTQNWGFVHALQLGTTKLICLHIISKTRGLFADCDSIYMPFNGDIHDKGCNKAHNYAEPAGVSFVAGVEDRALVLPGDQRVVVDLFSNWLDGAAGNAFTVCAWIYVPCGEPPNDYQVWWMKNRRWSNAGLILGDRRRRWPSI